MFSPIRSCRKHAAFSSSSAADLHVLPFLAPRLFSPWPNDTPSQRTIRQRRRNQTAAGDQAYLDAILDAYEDAVTVDAAHKPGQQSSPSQEPAKLKKALTHSRKHGFAKPLHVSTNAARSKKEIQSVHGEEETSIEKIAKYLTPEALALRYAPFSFEFREELELRRKTLLPLTGIWAPWPGKFSALFAGKLNGLSVEEVRNKISLGDVARPLVEELFKNGDDVENVRKIWENWSLEKKRRWPEIVLWMLPGPHRATSVFLAASNMKPLPHISMLADVLSYLEKFGADDRAADAELAELHGSLVKTMLEARDWSHVHKSDRCLQLLLRHASPSEVFKLVQRLRLRKYAFGPLSLLQVALFFTKAEKPRLAIQMLKYMVERGYTLESDEALQVCGDLLKLDTVEDRPNGRNFRLLPKLLQLGLVPNVLVTNIIISNATKSGDTEVAWNIFRYMQEEGITPDAHTLLHLLLDASERNDTVRIRNLFEYIRARPDLKHHRALASATLHYLRTKYFNLQRNPSAELYGQMLEVYDGIYNMEPLVDLGIAHADWLQSTLEPKPRPTTRSLGIMALAYLQVERNPQIILNVYHRFNQLVEAGDDDIAPLAEGDYVYNGFITALSRHPSTLHECIRVIEYMLQPFPRLPPYMPHHSRRLKKSPPTSRSWILLMMAFFRNKRELAAGKIAMMMQARGIEFDAKTYNVLIGGFSHAEMGKEAVEWLEKMMAANVPTDEWTFKALARSTDRGVVAQEIRRVLDGEGVFDANEQLDAEAEEVESDSSS